MERRRRFLTCFLRSTFEVGEMTTAQPPPLMSLNLGGGWLQTEARSRDGFWSVTGVECNFRDPLLTLRLDRCNTILVFSSRKVKQKEVKGRSGRRMAADVACRPLGDFERWFLTRNHIKFYTNVQVTTRLSVPSSLLARYDGIKSMVFLALKTVIEHHPILGVIVEDESDPKSSRWQRVDSVNLDNHVSFTKLESTRSLDQLLQGFNRLPIDRVDQVPLWRVVVTSEPPATATTQATSGNYFISFIFHHAICDGLSGCAFHVDFLEAVNDLAANTTSETLSTSALVRVPQNNLVDNVETRLNFSLGLFFTAKAIFNAFVFSKHDPKHWSGPGATQARPPQTRLRSFSVPYKTTEKLQQVCRSYDTTITALITVLVARRLATMYPEHSRFTASIPFSLRRLGGYSPRDMGVFFAAVSPPPMFSSEDVIPPGYISCKSETECPTQDDPKLWDAAQACRKHIIAGALVHNSSLGLLKYAGDLEVYMRGLLAKPREVAFEVTNLGVIDIALPASEGKASFDKLICSSSMSSFGPVYCVHLASVKQGDLSLVLSWEDGIVSDDEAEELVLSLEKSLLDIQNE